MQRSRGFGRGVMASKICYNAVIVLSVVLCDCCKPMNSCRDWAFSMLLAIVAWKCGCQPFRCPCWQNVTQCQTRFVGLFCFQESIPAIPFGNFLGAAAHSTSSALCLLYACKRSHPFVEDSGFVSCAEKHRFGHGVVVSKVCYRILECVFSHLPCRLLQCVEMELLATVGWKWGCQPFSCRCLQNVMRYGKDIFSTCSSRESI